MPYLEIHNEFTEWLEINKFWSSASITLWDKLLRNWSQKFNAFHAKYNYQSGDITLKFESASDAMLFKLIWG